MIDPKADKDKKLADAKRLDVEASDHLSKCNEERSRCAKGYHNTDGTGQWREDDLKYLESKKRQPITVNVLRKTIDQMIGMHMEQQRRASVRPVGGEDEFLASVMQDLCERVSDMADLEQVLASDLRNGYILGEGDCSLDVSPDPKNPAHLAFEAYSAEPNEIAWDPGSTKEDRSDAGYVCWDRWVTKSEFQTEYPEHIEAWDTLADTSDSAGDPGWYSQENSGESSPTDTDTYGKRREYYYDRKKRRARIVHLEYKVPRMETYAVMEGGAQLLTPDQVKRAKADEYGYWAGIELKDVWHEDVHLLEFCGTEILYDSSAKGGKPPFPFDGFSIDPFIYATDSVARIPYGPVRNLLDPQEELNKGIVSGSDLMVGQNKPGWILERGVADPRVFEAEITRTGGVATVEPGALTNNQLMPRPIPQVSTASLSRIENAVKFFEITSGIGTEMDQPMALNEPATNVMIRYHKSQLGLADSRDRFDRHLTNIWRKIVDTISRAMPDSQIAELLGNSKKYRVQGGMVIDMQSNPQQPRVASLRDLRALKSDIELDASTQNPTLRSLKVRQWLELLMAGVPIPPHLIAEAATDSRSEKELLREYAEQQAAQQQRAAMIQMQTQQLALQQTLQIEAGKAAETGRHNQAKELLEAAKQAGDLAAKFAQVFQQADATEKGAVVDMYREQVRSATARNQAALRVLPQPRGAA